MSVPLELCRLDLDEFLQDNRVVIQILGDRREIVALVASGGLGCIKGTNR
jgi:hypothetical protein